MSEKDFNLLMDLFDQKLHQEVSKEEAIRSLVNAGILDSSGNLTKPYEDLAVSPHQLYPMYDVKPNLIIGFHGCEAIVRDALLKNPNEIRISQKPFDWLGHGMYFWENNYERALQWAQQKKDRGAINEPAVIGAALYLGYCCDFLDRKYIQLLTRSFAVMEDKYRKSGKQLPSNKDLDNDPHKGKIMRHLDCAAIEFMHSEIFDQVQHDIAMKGYSDYKIFDTARGVFTEGGPAFQGAGLFAKSHIQICVRNPNCIQGFFMPREEIDFMKWLGQNKPTIK